MPSTEVDGAHATNLLAILEEAASRGTAVPRVLVLHRDATVAKALQADLSREEAQVLTAATPAEARDRLAEGSPDVILCNPDIAEEGSGRFCAELTQHAAAIGTPVIAARGENSPLSEAELYEMGFDIVLERPVKRSVLLAVIRSTLRKGAARRSRMMEDAATGQPNLTQFHSAFRRASSLAAREREPLTVVLLHVGALGRVRRRAGLAAADEALRGVVQEVAAVLRHSDLLARGHGDSLLILLPNTDASGADRVIQKIHDRMEWERLAEPEPRFDLLLAGGTAEASPHLSFDEVVEAAVRRLRPIGDPLARSGTRAESAQGEAVPRVMIAEDDPLTASIIKHRLERLGCDVVHVTDGEAVLRMVPAADLSLLILDVKMPYVDGFEALRRLRSIRTLRDLPIMMVTSMGNEQDVARGFELGANDYLVKPFSPVELQARVQRLLP